MKKILALLLTVLLVLSLAACGDKSDDKDKKDEPKAPAEIKVDETEAEATEAGDVPIDGGWSDNQSVTVPDDVKAMFDKLNETMTGGYYVPVAYLESQVVAGTNHLVLCKMIPSVGDAIGSFVLVTVYEDLEGKAEIISVQTSGAEAPQPYNPENPVAGGWGEPETPEVTDEAKAALEKAVEELDGVTYEPKALLGTQVVAGMNYLILCKSTPVVPDAESAYVILTVYADLDGNAKITAIDEFGPATDTPADADGVEFIDDSEDAEAESSEAE